LEAIRIIDSPSGRPSTGSLRTWPVRAPVVVSIVTFAPESHEVAVARPRVSR
jgi:hypothetical protein